jgi:hypothetical protein
LNHPLHLFAGPKHSVTIFYSVLSFRGSTVRLVKQFVGKQHRWQFFPYNGCHTASSEPVGSPIPLQPKGRKQFSKSDVEIEDKLNEIKSLSM